MIGAEKSSQLCSRLLRAFSTLFALLFTLLLIVPGETVATEQNDSPYAALFSIPLELVLEINVVSGNTNSNELPTIHSLFLGDNAAEFQLLHTTVTEAVSLDTTIHLAIDGHLFPDTLSVADLSSYLLYFRQRLRKVELYTAQSAQWWVSANGIDSKHVVVNIVLDAPSRHALDTSFEEVSQ